MAITQADFDRRFLAELRNRNFEVSLSDARELLTVAGGLIQDCLQEEIKEAQKYGWGRSKNPRSRRKVQAPPNGKIPTPTVVVRDIARFTVREYPARTGRNPQTGASIKIAASQRMRVAAPKPLRDALGVK